jgi:hypothetical protein
MYKCFIINEVRAFIKKNRNKMFNTNDTNKKTNNANLINLNWF